MLEKISNTVRAVFIETDVDGFEYFTHGGTVTLVEYQNKVYGLTCGHVVNADKTIEYRQLCILNERGGNIVAGIENIATPKNLGGIAVDSDVADICVIEFSKDSSVKFFNATPYQIRELDAISDISGEKLYALGASKEKSGVDYENVKLISQYVCLPVYAQGRSSIDQVLYEAEGVIPDDWNLSELTGMSGGAIYNEDQHNRLSGIIARAGVKEKKVKIFYIDISIFVKAIQSIEDGSLKVTHKI